jgi:hypothetical protein
MGFLSRFHLHSQSLFANAGEGKDASQSISQIINLQPANPVFDPDAPGQGCVRKLMWSMQPETTWDLSLAPNQFSPGGDMYGPAVKSAKSEPTEVF